MKCTFFQITFIGDEDFTGSALQGDSMGVINGGHGQVISCLEKESVYKKKINSKQILSSQSWCRSF